MVMIVDHIIRTALPFSFALSSSKACTDIHQCRTVPNIVYNCMSTIFLCTWVALHLDLRKDPFEAPWKGVLRRVGWMMVALIAPEALLFVAFADWTVASSDLKDKLRQDPACNWTEAHAMLARMGGLQVVEEDGSREIVKRIQDVPSDVEMLTKAEIQDKGKADTIAKTLTIVQTLWFALQALHRAIKGFLVMGLELTTLGHVSLNLFIYWCWWNKPLNLRFPLNVYRKKHGKRREGSPEGDKKKSEAAGLLGYNEKQDAELQGPIPGRNLSIRTRMGAYLYRSVGESRGTELAVVLISYSLIGGIFGAVHLLAWNSISPTHIEHTFWRACSSIVTAFPGLGLTVVVVAGNLGVAGIVINIFAGLMAVVYSLARLCLLALGFASLRALPLGSFQVPVWAGYVPHIG